MFHSKTPPAVQCVSDHWLEKPREILLLCQASSSIEYCDIVISKDLTSGFQKQRWRSSSQIKYFWPIDISDVHGMKKLVHQLYLLRKDSQIADHHMPPRKSLMIRCMHGSGGG